VLEVQERPPSMLKHRWQPPWEAVPEIWEHPPSTQKTSTTTPLGRGAKDLGASTINAKNIDGGPPRRRCRRSGSTHHQCKKVDGGPLGRRCQRSKSAHHKRKERQWWGPLGGGARDPRASTINVKTLTVGPKAGLYQGSKSCVVSCIGIIDKSNSAHGSHSPCT
jgi:hypothetical protein